MRIALMGTRGIPANYGGFETFYENLAPRLVARGHEVTVYNRPHAIGRIDRHEYRGVRLINVPSIRTKHLDTITHTFASVIHGLRQRYDIVYVCGVGNTPVAWIPRLGRAAVVLNVDSSDWKRRKWGPVAATYLRATERFAARTANVIVADSRVIQARYRESYRAEARYFPYGANILEAAGTDTLEAHGLAPDGYILWVGRLEPETLVEELIRAFSALERPRPRLVIVGDAPFAGPYRESLAALATEDVLFTGYQFGDAYRQLSFHAMAYVQTSPTSGTSPALLEQMAAGGAVIVRGTATNLETIADGGLSYDPHDPVAGLSACLRRVIGEPDLRDRLGDAARTRVAEAFSWDRITDDYEQLFRELKPRSSRPRAMENTCGS
jgi:glycosyltransferase involved in cell wall biosynthesis